MKGLFNHRQIAQELQRKRARKFWFLGLMLSVLITLTGCQAATDSSSAPDLLTSPKETSALALSQERMSSPAGQGKLRISYIDVGQGDSILIQVPNGKNVLIDAGENDQGDKVVSYLRRQGVKRLDATIWTHPHSDHIGGADIVTNAFEIGQVYMPKISSTTQSYRSLIEAIRQKGLKITEVKAGLTLDLGPGISAQFLAPNSTHYEEVNDYSAVLKLIYGENTFLFTGDAGTESEKEMLQKGYNLKADVLKVGHHGSRTSSTPTFLAKVQPQYAVISVGKGNDYGHPAADTLKRLQQVGATVYRTDQSGTIVAESDGKNITWTKERTK